MWTDVFTCNMLFHIRFYFYYCWNGPLMHISFLWSMKHLEVQEQSLTDKTDTDGKQTFCITCQREKPQLYEWSVLRWRVKILPPHFLDIPIKKLTAHYRIKQPKQQGLALSTGYFPSSIIEALVKRTRQTVIQKF